MVCGVRKENYTPEERVKRELFITSQGLLNADVNAVRNYLKKLGRFDLTKAPLSGCSPTRSSASLMWGSSHYKTVT